MTETKRVYIAGPMRNIPYYNATAFSDAAANLFLCGYLAVSPVELDTLFGVEFAECPTGTEDVGLSPRSLIDRDLAAIADCDAVVLLEGWERSMGVAVEKAYAEFLGIPVLPIGAFLANDR